MAFIAEMKKKYWNATHNCSAFVIGENQNLQRCSDDGEPQGTAGRPMLDVLLGEEIHNLAVVVTRYFGGTLLGTGGLVRAYTQAIQSAIENAKEQNLISAYEKLIEWEIEVSYSLLSQILYLAQKTQTKVLQRDFLSHSVKLILCANLASKEEFENLCASEAVLMC